MHIGIVCELQEQPPLHTGLVASIDVTAEFATTWEVEQLAATLAELGHETTVIGDMAALVRFLGCGGAIDLVFNYAAGVWGRAREAQVPALLEALRVPYTGADAFTLTVCIDKALVKQLWRAAGLPATPVWTVQDCAELAGAAEALGGFPLFVKPAREGSSKGVSPGSVVRSEAALAAQVNALLAHYRPVLVEPYLPGREFSVGVLGSGPGAQALGAVEIRHGAASLVDVLGKKAWAPQTFQPVLDSALYSQLCALGVQAFRVLDCQTIARVDMRMDREGNVQLIEINPNPGLHPTRSAMPALARLAGLSYANLIDWLIGLALAATESHHDA
jgi:D-alanine-D-alanine ligase